MTGPRPERPNIVLIMPDQHRGDALGCAGSPVVRSPNIDRLAEQGVLFRRAFSQSPLCQPARASLLTGKYPHQHGTVTNRLDFPEPDEPNFLNALREAGYHVASVGKVHIGVIPEGTARWPYLSRYGFTEMEEVHGKIAFLKMDSPYTERLAEAGVLDDLRDDLRRRMVKMTRDEPNWFLRDEEVEGVEPVAPWHAAPVPVPEELFVDNYVGDLAVEWLERYHGEGPFFLWVGFCGPHDPYDAPQSYADPYLALGHDLPVGPMAPPEDTPSEAYNRELDFYRRYSGTGRMSADDVRRLRAFYYGNVTLIDRRIGDIVRVLEKRGMFENTWIIYTSDHGDLVGDHQLLAKVVMYDGAISVPLIVRPPGGMAGRVVDDLVELGDAGATILAAAGIDPLPGSEARSLAGYVDGTEDHPREAVFFEVRGFSGLLTDEYKYVVERETGIPVLLFDRSRDPDENHNLADTDTELGSELEERHLRRFLEV